MSFFDDSAFREENQARKSQASPSIDESESRIAVLTSQQVKVGFERAQILALYRRLRAVLNAHILWLIGWLSWKNGLREFKNKM